MTRRSSKAYGKHRFHGIKAGYRSGLEEKLAAYLQEHGVDPACYETLTLTYVKPARSSKYTPDFPLPNGIIVESKGRFTAADREKHLLVKQQHPDKDIRFVFQRSVSPLYKGAKSTYADWCRKHGFQFADKVIPESWLTEEKKA